jgi:hypothetical protein
VGVHPAEDGHGAGMDMDMVMQLGTGNQVLIG